MFFFVRLFVNVISAAIALMFAVFLLIALFAGILNIDIPLAFGAFVASLFVPLVLCISDAIMHDTRSLKGLLISGAWVLWSIWVAVVFVRVIYGDVQLWTQAELFWASLISWVLPLLVNSMVLYRQLRRRSAPITA